MGSVDWFDGEGLVTNKDDANLSTNHNAVDTNKEVVPEHPLKDIELIIKTTVAVKIVSINKSLDGRREGDILELVEDLHPDKGVENHRLEFLDLGLS